MSSFEILAASTNISSSQNVHMIHKGPVVPQTDPLLESCTTALTQITKVNPTLTKDEFCQTPPETSEEEVKDLPIKEEKDLTNEQRKNYEKLVAQIIKESIERENRQLQ